MHSLLLPVALWSVSFMWLSRPNQVKYPPPRLCCITLCASHGARRRRILKGRTKETLCCMITSTLYSATALSTLRHTFHGKRNGRGAAAADEEERMKIIKNIFRIVMSGGFDISIFIYFDWNRIDILVVLSLRCMSIHLRIGIKLPPTPCLFIRKWYPTCFPWMCQSFTFANWLQWQI